MKEVAEHVEEHEVKPEGLDIHEAIERIRWAPDSSAWTYRRPVSVHLIDNRLVGSMKVFWGPGPGGRFMRRIAAVLLGVFRGF